MGEWMPRKKAVSLAKNLGLIDSGEKFYLDIWNKRYTDSQGNQIATATFVEIALLTFPELTARHLLLYAKYKHRRSTSPTPEGMVQVWPEVEG